jgi:hypothetical protein
MAVHAAEDCMITGSIEAISPQQLPSIARRIEPIDQVIVRFDTPIGPRH